MISDPNLPLAPDSAGSGELTPSAGGPASSASTAPSVHLHPVLHLWLRRASVLLFVFLCATVGVMLVILPWRPEWTDNHLLMPFPAVRTIVGSGFVRGVCTGLGLLNIWIGFWEAIQYREEE